ncbi:cytosine/adenosine deaminase-related metal-dependent hydrolase [Lentzea atacamensis]|uniref:Cytosine/adenosine deaminase-related metal-dependent hydrolase n=1 Tax=Lentzea atacamensis TaxID=531938 RepID=A0ABX9E8L4_9PSEU|nr:amidohydrolase family protein [Lentzea atacamensis]RAS66035.1 cytosine/adenosine deaminase-related metal-dependent hydrolase [Lentzea atacamensis]
MDFVLRNALVIDTDPVVVMPGTDVLVSDGRIAAVGKGLPAATVIDCTDRIVLPGFVDTHRHLWQVLMRSFCADMTLGEYLERMLMPVQAVLSPDELRIGTLAGALECMASGITTVQDFSFAPTFGHAEAAVRGLRESGVRAMYGYGQPVFGPACAEEDVRRGAALGGGLVDIALAPLGPSFSDIGVVERDWLLARSLGMRVVTHVAGKGNPISALRDRGLLDANTTFVHGNELGDDELKLVAEAGAGVSIAPAVEAVMGHGVPMVRRTRAFGVPTGLGVDTVTAVAGDMFSLMRAALLSTHLSEGVHVTPADVLRMATIEGAAAIGMADRVGSLGVGKHADLVVLRADDLNLLGTHDPVAALVTAAHPGNLEKVFVGGVEAETQDVAGAVRDVVARLKR